MVRTKLPDVGFNIHVKTPPGKGLAGRFLISPFSVLRSYDGEWLKRKRQWIRLGIKSELGRSTETYQIGNKKKWDRGVLHRGSTIDAKNGEKWEGGQSAWQNSGTSIFDPVLCELMYAWFCPKAGLIVDPFAGGSVRGIVAAMMGYQYWGCELRQEQVDANRTQAKTILQNKFPTWKQGDSFKELPEAPESDFVFSCPPYGNLEVYSDLTEDLSTMEYTDFIFRYKLIIRRAVQTLRDNRFACFVVANFRDKKTGFYNDFVGDTIKAFKLAGMGFYNDATLVTPTGSLPVRTGKQFHVSRKMGKTHQNILIFYKGDPKEIRNIFND
jgi:hypothetical protein